MVQLVPLASSADLAFFTDSTASFIAGNGSLMVLDSNTNQYHVGRIFNRHSGTRLSGTNCTIVGLSVLRENRTLEYSGFSVISGPELEIMVCYSINYVDMHVGTSEFVYFTYLIEG